MDPDRGILTFISFIETPLKKIWIVYNLEGIGRHRTLVSIHDVKNRFIEKLKEDGMPKWFIADLIKIINTKNLTLNSKIDITGFWETRLNKIQNNKVLATIVYFSDGMFLNRNGPLLYWDRMKLIGCKRAHFIESLREVWGLNLDVAPAALRKIVNVVDEDEVTYTIVHRILRPNNFKIISVSYPGAQGSAVILPDTGKGRRQKRQYLDIVALPPVESIKDIKPIIEESKGMFNETELTRAVMALSKFKRLPTSQNALKSMLVRIDAKYKDSRILHILIGVGFGTSDHIQTLWNPGEVDFIVRLENRDTWSIGIFNQDLLQCIPQISGKTNLPIVYEVVPFNENNITQMLIYEK